MNRGRRLTILAVFLSPGAAIATDAFSGHRLFHSPAQRLERIGVEHALETEAVVPVRELPPVKTTMITEHKKISFDGLVVRHTLTDGSSSIVWIDGERQNPGAWITHQIKDFRYPARVFGKSLLLGVGQSLNVSVTRNVKSAE